jgi:hypothetical protein
MQRRAHLSSLMTRSACALWTGLASAPLAAAAVVTSASGSQAAPTFAAATIAACTGGIAAWIRAGRGARAVAAHLQVLHPGEPVLATVRCERLSDTLGLTASMLDRSGAQGVKARQAVWTAARARRVTRRR